ncbi:MAG: hypothetical protein ACKV2Q_08875 [Planctomycetaceae bacterium]
MADYQAISNVMKQILALSQEEQHQIREQLKLLDLPPVEMSEREKNRRLAEKLYAEGVFSHIPAVWPPVERPERPLIKVKGPPVSQTIIEERR